MEEALKSIADAHGRHVQWELKRKRAAKDSVEEMNELFSQAVLGLREIQRQFEVPLRGVSSPNDQDGWFRSSVGGVYLEVAEAVSVLQAAVAAALQGAVLVGSGHPRRSDHGQHQPNGGQHPGSH